MKKTLSVLLAFAMLFAIVACAPAAQETAATAAEAATEAPAAAEATAAAEKTIKIGFVNAGPDDYYNVSAEIISKAGAQRGWEVTVLNSEYTPEKEISNVEDLIAMGVDGIMIIAANMESAQTATQKANEAGIPIVFVAGGPAKGEGVPTTVVAGNWAFSGQWHANNLNEVFPDAKVILAEAVAGQDIGTLITDNFESNFKGEVVGKQYCNWSRSETLAYVQDLIAKNQEMDVIFAYNEEQAAGAKQALEENGFKPGDVWIISNNGKPLGLEMIQDGWMQYTVEFAPTTEAYVGVLAMEAVLAGKEVKPFIENPAVCISADNIGDAITWDPEQFLTSDYQKMDMDAIMASILA
ncbi:MAG: sugar ABC transporter substrate-binding protein [Eubacteriales bacterium]|nr:sugar ABC transporter substrate-binding protein [Eubacteriales bacterium]